MKLTVHYRADFVLAVVMWLIAGLIYPLTNDTAKSPDSGPAILLTFGGFFVVSLTRLGLALGRLGRAADYLGDGNRHAFDEQKPRL